MRVPHVRGSTVLQNFYYDSILSYMGTVAQKKYKQPGTAPNCFPVVYTDACEHVGGGGVEVMMESREGKRRIQEE